MRDAVRGGGRLQVVKYEGVVLGLLVACGLWEEEGGGGRLVDLDLREAEFSAEVSTGEEGGG